MDLRWLENTAIANYPANQVWRGYIKSRIETLCTRRSNSLATDSQQGITWTHFNSDICLSSAFLIGTALP